MKNQPNLAIIPSDDKGAMLTVHPDNLHDEWGWVRPGLVNVMNQGADGWIPEDVFMAIKLGSSSLHISPDRDGFVVLTPVKGYQCLRVHIWCAWSSSGNAVETYLSSIKSLARQIGAKKLTFESCRKGWEKLFTPILTRYEEDL